jgi:hypothetical protein
MALGTPANIGYEEGTNDSYLDITHSGISIGDLVIVSVGLNDTTLDGYTCASIAVEAEAFTQAVVSSNNTCSIWYLVATATHSNATTVNVVFNGVLGSFVASVEKVTGVTATPLDKTNSGTGTGTLPNTGQTGILSQESEIEFAAVVTHGPVADSAGSWDSPFNTGALRRTGIGIGPSGCTISTVWRTTIITTSSGASKTGITSRVWSACIATFMATATVMNNSGMLNQSMATLVGARWSTNNWWIQRSLLDDDD